MWLPVEEYNLITLLPSTPPLPSPSPLPYSPLPPVPSPLSPLPFLPSPLGLISSPFPANLSSKDGHIIGGTQTETSRDWSIYAQEEREGTVIVTLMCT